MKDNLGVIKEIDFNTINNLKNEKNIEAKNKFIETEKLMGEILSDKEELQNLYFKLRDKLNQIDPNRIREFSKKL